MAESRWTIEFKQHTFQSLWVQLKTEISKLEVDDQTVEASVLEVLRLKRVVTYLDAMIASVDPDLTPKSVWANFHGQLEPCLAQVVAYKSNKNIKHIRQANEHADNLLTYLRPYEVLPEQALTALSGASQAYSRELTGLVDSLRARSEAILIQLEEDKTASAQDRAATDKHRKRIESYFNELFVGTEDEQPVESKIGNLHISANTKFKAIDDLHAALLVGSPQSLSLQAKVKSMEAEVESTRDKLNVLLDGTQSEVRALDAFHEKIFGKKDESGKATSGLESELEARQTQLKKLEDEQKIKHSALFTQIESLLPGATSAGLATSYKALKDKFTAPIARYTILFYASLAALVFAAVLMAVQEITFAPFALKLVEVKEWDVILRALTYKAPFVAPVIWLAIFSSTRRSQYERLQQEYAHKEALASSYESFKKQLEALKVEGDGLQRELIAKAIEAIAYNASVTLDGKHQDKLPAEHIFEKLSVDELKKFAEFVKTLRPV